MTRTWSQTARTALDGGRIWRGLVKDRPATEGDLGFRAVDMIVLSLLLDIAEATEVVCADEALTQLIAQVFAQAETAPRAALAVPGAGRHVRLTSVRRLAGSAPVDAEAAAHLVYGVAEGLPLSGAGETVLRLVAGSAPALWQSGLAVVATGDGAAAMAMIAALGLSMRGEWIDPLALYERVQVLTAKLNAQGPEVDAGETRPARDRIAELEREIATLKRAALVNQHLLLVDAAERVRVGP